MSLFALIDRWLAPAPPPGRVAWLRGASFAHRGLHGANLPENSPGAFAAAIARGLGIECDVQITADGQAMVIHDFTLERLTDAKGAVRELTVAALAATRLRGSKDGIPGLPDLLRLVAGQVPLLIEVKMRRYWAVGPLCRAVASALAGYGGAHAVMSFDPRVSRWFAGHAPATPRGLVMTEENDRGVWARIRRHLALWLARPDFLACDIGDLPSRFAGAQRQRGLPIATWTVRSPEQLTRAHAHADAPIAEAGGVA